MAGTGERGGEAEDRMTENDLFVGQDQHPKRGKLRALQTSVQSQLNRAGFAGSAGILAG